MKTAIVSAATGTYARDLVRSGVLARLLRAGVRCVVVSPAYADDRFRLELEGIGAIVEPMLPYRMGAVEGFGVASRRSVLAHRDHVGSLKTIIAPRKLSDWPRHLLLRAIAHGPGRMIGFRRWLERLEFDAVRLIPSYLDLLDKYQVSAIVTGSPGYNPLERPLLKAARIQNIPILCAVSSWDNLTGKGAMLVIPDELLVWNPIMQEEAIRYHGLPRDRVTIVGVPQFDRYVDSNLVLPRTQFARSLGFKPEQRLITYATSPQTISDQSVHFINVLLKGVQAQRWGDSILLVRVHQRDTRELYDQLKGQPRVLVDLSGRTSEHMDWDPNEADLVRLASTMAHSDVVINIASTITIDAACFDTPSINIYYDGPVKKKYVDSTRRYYDYVHYHRLVTSGGVALVRSDEELLKAVDRYLGDRELDSAGRRRIVDQIAWRLDGQASYRIAGRLLEAIDKRHTG